MHEPTTILQPMARPDPKICSEQKLFARLHGRAHQSLSTGDVRFEIGAQVQFDTYFNVFNIGKWTTHCGLKDIGLQLSGEGTIELTVCIVYANQSPMRLIDEIITLEPSNRLQIQVPLEGRTPHKGVLYFEFRGVSKGVLSDANWYTTQQPLRSPKLALSVTTFRREEAVRTTVNRFKEFVKTSRFGDQMHLFVVDNGKSANIPVSEKVTPIENENYGGAGGFTRGLIEGMERGFTHCLFMDDDASTLMDAVDRTWIFLAYATEPKTAVAGAMITTSHIWAIWENGAEFDGVCRPLHGGTDLREPEQLFRMEHASTPRQSDKFYGGWWFFAFPLEHVEHLPFPFFVRGDDVSFSLVHDFNITTLPGVVSFQESFTEKDSPLTWYLDLRSHLAHHLSLPNVDDGQNGLAVIALWFWARTFLTCHYETMEAINIAIEDVMRGPEYFADNADMAQRRADIGKLQKKERWIPCAVPRERRYRKLNPDLWVTRWFMKLTLNGLLLPGFQYIGDHIVLPTSKRWRIRDHWGVASITYHDASEHKAYTVTHNKRRAIGVSLKTLKLIWTLRKRYPKLKKKWAEEYDRLTDRPYWDQTLGLSKSSEGP
ncbi:MAG: glycosyl transferase [Pseudomonadota bacterium]